MHGNTRREREQKKPLDRDEFLVESHRLSIGAAVKERENMMGMLVQRLSERVLANFDR